MLPQELDICLTNRCNMRCAYCYARARNIKTGPELSLKTVERAMLLYLKGCAAAGVVPEKISVSGGEPLLRASVLYALAGRFRGPCARRAALEVFTNGLLLTPAAAARLLVPGVALKLSLDGDGADRGGRALESGAASQAAVLERARRLSAAQRRRVWVSATVTRANARRFGANMKFLLGEGFGRISPSFAVEENWSRSEYAALTAEFRDFKKFLRSAPARHRSAFCGFTVKLTGPGPASLEEFTRTNEISLAPDGFFYPCSILSASAAAMSRKFNDEYRMGSVRAGIDAEKFLKLRRRAHAEIAAYGRRRYPGCLMCVYYMSKVNSAPLAPLLAGAGRLAELAFEAGLAARREN